MAITLTALLFLIIAAALGAGGVWLAVLGGSWYYIIAALAFLLTSILLFRRRPSALLVYAILIVGTLGWAIWETGFDWWQLAPRGGVIILLALWMLTPWVRGRLARAGGESSAAGTGALWVAVLVALGVAGYSMAQDPQDISGQLSKEVIASAPDLGGVPNDDWHFYGRSLYGQRYSPLKQITPDNVSKLQVAWTFQTGDVRRSTDVPETTYQVTPLKVRDTLFLCTPTISSLRWMQRAARKNGGLIRRSRITMTVSIKPAVVCPIMPMQLSLPASPAPSGSICRRRTHG